MPHNDLDLVSKVAGAWHNLYKVTFRLDISNWRASHAQLAKAAEEVRGTVRLGIMDTFAAQPDFCLLQAKIDGAAGRGRPWSPFVDEQQIPLRMRWVSTPGAYDKRLTLLWRMISEPPCCH